MKAVPSPLRVMIATPCGDMVHADFAYSLAAMVNHIHADGVPGLTELSIQNIRTSVLPDSRNKLVKQAIAGRFTHMLWIDSDMVFPHDMLARLVAFKRDIVGINASMRGPPYLTTAQTAHGVRCVTNSDSTGLERVEHMGFGVALVRVGVFVATAWPWFSFEPVMEKRVHRGEDYYFCAKAQAKGYKLWIDHDLSREVGHVGNYAYRPMRDTEEARATG